MAGISTSEEIASLRKHYLEPLDLEISTTSWTTLLLSAEGVSNLTRVEISKIREWGEQYAKKWRVVVCVRHPLAYTRSVIQQIMKGGDTLQELYSDPPIPNFKGKLTNAIDVFGQDNLRIFDFDDASHTGGGITKVFSDMVGLSPDTGQFLEAHTESTNESLSSSAVHILDSLNRRRPMFLGSSRAPRRAGPRHELHYLERIPGSTFDLPEAIKEKIRRATHDDVAWLNESFGLNLYPDLVSAPSSSFDHDDSVDRQLTHDRATIDSIAEIFGELVTRDVYHNQLNRGRAALEKGDLPLAEKCIKEATRLEPDEPEPKALLEKVVGALGLGDEKELE
ncbi:MAG: hypothetical protein GEU79_11245 [Acidimicrobiia bacterium]|nr:hypothetical protein [Acidimicrobiia bacterium]